MNCSPSRSSTHGVTGSIGWASASARISSNDECCASRSRLRRVGKISRASPRCRARERLGRRKPYGASALALDDRGCQSPRAPGDEERACRTGGRRGISEPSARTGSARRVERQTANSSSASASGLVGDKRVLKQARLCRVRHRAEAQRGLPFPRSFRGLPRSSADRAQLARQARGRPRRSARRGRPERRPRTPCRRRARPSAARAGRPARSRTTIRVAAGMASSLMRGLGRRVLSYIPLTFCSSASCGVDGLSSAAFSSLELAASAAPSAPPRCWPRPCAAWLAASLSWSAGRLVHLGVLTRILVVAVARRNRQRGQSDNRKSQSFHALSFPRKRSTWRRDRPI